MQRVTLVRYTTRPGKAEENAALSLAVFKELRAGAPAHVAYALFRDGDDFVHLFVNSRDEDAAMLTELPSFKAYDKDIGARAAAAPEQTRMVLELLDSYGLA